MSERGVGLDRLDLQAILLRGSADWNNWRKGNPKAFIDLRGASLDGADLSGADLSEADLTSVNLREANLSGAILSRAILKNAHLSRAILRGAILNDTILDEAYLDGSRLSGAILDGASLRWAVLRGAILNGSHLRGAILRGAILYEAYLCGSLLNEADFNGAKLIRTDLSGADLKGAFFSGANLSGADLSGADLKGAILKGAILKGAKGIDRKLLEGTLKIRVFDATIDPASLKELKQALSVYADAAGYVEPDILREEYGSWISDIRYKVSQWLTPAVTAEAIREGEDLYRRSKANLKAQLEKSGVESTQQIVTATAQLLKAIENFDNIVLTLGKLVAVKYTDEQGRTQTIVRTVSTEIQNQLESSPHLLDNPQAFVQFLESKTEPAAIAPADRTLAS